MYVVDMQALWQTIRRVVSQVPSVLQQAHDLLEQKQTNKQNKQQKKHKQKSSSLASAPRVTMVENMYLTIGHIQTV